MDSVLSFTFTLINFVFSLLPLMSGCETFLEESLNSESSDCRFRRRKEDEGLMVPKKSNRHLYLKNKNIYYYYTQSIRKSKTRPVMV